MALTKPTTSSGSSVAYTTTPVPLNGSIVLDRNFCGYVASSSTTGYILANDAILMCQSTTYGTMGSNGPWMLASGTVVCSSGSGSGILTGYYFD